MGKALPGVARGTELVSTRVGRKNMPQQTTSARSIGEPEQRHICQGVPLNMECGKCVLVCLR